MSDEEILQMFGQWVVDTCLLFGTTAETAHKAAGLFCEGLRNEWAADHPADQETSK